MRDALRLLVPAPLTREAFRPFGDVLDASGEADDVANCGAAQVFRDRALADFEAEGGRTRFNIVRIAPKRLPLEIELVERHPLSSQLFSPLAGADWLVVVAPPGALDPEAIAAFRTRPNQAVRYRRGVWHYPLVALGRPGDFLVVDRWGEGANLDIQRLEAPLLISSLGD
jgi:ureidoglycolate lyase